MLQTEPPIAMTTADGIQLPRTFRFQLTKDDIAARIRLFRSVRQTTMRNFLIVYLATCALAGWVEHELPDQWRWILQSHTAFTIAAFIFWIIVFQIISQIRRRREIARTPVPQSVNVLTIDDERIDGIEDGRGFAYGWDQIYEPHFSKARIFLQPTGNSEPAVILPRAAFDSDDDMSAFFKKCYDLYKLADDESD